MKTLVEDLTGERLDLAVVVAEGFKHLVRHDPMGFHIGSEAGYWLWEAWLPGCSGKYHRIGHDYAPTRNWSQIGHVIEPCGIRWNKNEDGFYAWAGGHDYYDPLHIPMSDHIHDIPNPDAFQYGSTLLEAVCRCFVELKLGEEIDLEDLT